jgi:hypothetical protein
MSSKSTPRRTQVPAIPEIVAGDATAAERSLRAIKEAVEVGYGRRGDPKDRFATLRDLQDAGLVNVVADGRGGTVIVNPGPGTGAPLPPTGPTRPNYGGNDFTVPPQPQNVRARGLPPDLPPASTIGTTVTSEGLVMVTWDAPSYGNHAYAEIYRMPRGANPQDSNGGPLLNLNSNGFNPAYAYGVNNGSGTLNVFTGGQAVLAGVADGTIFIDRNLAPIPEVPPGGTPLDAALNPGRYYYWVRFISFAMVPGPLSVRAEARLSINPTLVLDEMTRNVTNTPIFANLRGWLALGSPEASSGANILEYIDNQIGEGSISSIWSLRMAQRVDGLVFSAGFGLGLETTRGPDGDWTSLSTFLINANQFAIMGANTLGGGSIITGWTTLSGNTIRLSLASAGHGFTVSPPGSPRQRATLMIPTGDIRTPAADPEDPPDVTPIPYSFLAGTEVEVTAVNGASVEVTSQLDTRQPQNPPTFPGFSGAPNGSVPETWQMALMPGTNIPFIVDTLRNVVGIRGSLIVDGLVRGTVGEFNELIANTAFIRQLQAEVVNANVVIGQRLIAGTPGRGPLTPTSYNGISNYIVELNNPASSQFAIRMWKPSTGHTVFSLDSGSQNPATGGDVFIGGHLTVAGSGVIAGGAQAATDVLFSTGGEGADTGIPGLLFNQKYAIWVGQKQHYGQRGELRNEANGIFWVKSGGRAGFNADVFLGESPFSIPVLAAGNNSGSAVTQSSGGPRAASLVTTSVTNEPISVRALRSGGASLVHVQVSGQMYSMASGGGDGRTKRFRVKVQLVGSPSASSGTLIHEVEMDDYSPETWVYSLSGAVLMAPGNYYVRIDLTNIEDRPMSIIQGWNALAMQVVGQGGLAPALPNQTAMRYTPPAALQSLDEVRAFEGASPRMVEAAEDVPMGAFVNIFLDSGIAKFQAADRAVPAQADGFILETVTEGQRIEVFAFGLNDRLSGLTPGTEYALGTNGAVVTLASSSTMAGHIRQLLGKALTPTTLEVRITEAILQ